MSALNGVPPVLAKLPREWHASMDIFHSCTSLRRQFNLGLAKARQKRAPKLVIDWLRARRSHLDQFMAVLERELKADLKPTEAVYNARLAQFKTVESYMQFRPALVGIRRDKSNVWCMAEQFDAVSDFDSALAHAQESIKDRHDVYKQYYSVVTPAVLVIESDHTPVFEVSEEYVKFELEKSSAYALMCILPAEELAAIVLAQQAGTI